MKKLQINQKVYSYIDETGQDTGSKFFIVSIIITKDDRDKIITILEIIEKTSKKTKTKWIKSIPKYRLAYIKETLHKNLPLKIFYSCYENERDFTLATILSTAKVLKQAKYDQCKNVVFIDGLPKTKQKFISNQLHKLGVRLEKVRGIRKEENDAILRLADAIAGFIRKVKEGDKKTIMIFNQVKKNIKEI